MANLTTEQLKAIPKKRLLGIVKKLKDKVKDHQVILDLFKKYNVPPSVLDYVPIYFSDIDVSAKTEHGIIILNIKLLEDGNYEQNDHYIVHETCHVLQQCFGEDSTQGADDGDYLLNPYEQEGFQNQTEYLADTRGEDEAEAYINQVLDHHDVEGKDRKDKKEILLKEI
jgi:hypothetical protein